jgi:putative oxidoreductase
LAADAAETGGGALIALGFLTPLGAAALIGTMATAIRTVHFKNGPWVTNGGYEYNLALMTAMVALADVGPGDLSVDHALGIEVSGPLVALLALVGGIGVATFTTQSSESEPSGAESLAGDPAAAASEAPAAATA